MKKITLLLILTLAINKAFTQSDLLVLKKKERTLQTYWTNSFIVFQTKDRQWVSGAVTRITKDSFYLTREIVHYTMSGSDTVHYSGFRYALSDIYALPTKKEEFVYRDEQVHVILGNEKFVWIRNGVIFQALGAGYIGLNLANTLIAKEPPFGKKNLPRLGVAGIVLVAGTIMHFTFDPYIHLGKKYSIQWVPMASH